MQGKARNIRGAIRLEGHLCSLSLINNRGRDDGNRQLTNKGNSTGDILLFYVLIYREGNDHDLSNHVLVLFGVKYVYQGSISLEAASPIFFRLTTDSSSS